MQNLVRASRERNKATYKAVWDNIVKSPQHAQSVAMVMAGKSIYNLVGKGLFSYIHNYFSPPKTRAERVNRRVYYETLYDNLAPDNESSTILSTISDVKVAKDEVSKTVSKQDIKVPTNSKPDVKSPGNTTTVGGFDVRDVTDL